MNKIEIYTNESCGYCKSVKEELEKENIEFKNKITTENFHEWQEVINLTKLATVPTVKCNNQYFVPQRDFQSPQQLINILKTFKESSHDDSKQTLELLKTLYSGVHIAFGKLDQLLRQIETNTKKDETL
tara:strand:+ start:175 stop:561 length:387 start_codon:yes stop_codon:yes gene_type:complete